MVSALNSHVKLTYLVWLMTLQSDLAVLQAWTEKWQMELIHPDVYISQSPSVNPSIIFTAYITNHLIRKVSHAKQLSKSNLL